MHSDAEKERKKKLEEKKIKRFFPNISATVSATECTGLIPAMPDDDWIYATELFSMEYPPVEDDPNP